MSLLKEVTLKEYTGIPIAPQRPDLKKSDGSDAGATDVAGKMRPNDVSFSSMRNTINSDGEITGSNVADYLERAQELNDEVDTIPFGLETDDGDIVKVYVNAEEADKFEEAMKKLLGVEDDIEEAINKLAQEFDIVDVVWPKEKEEGDKDDDIDLDAGGDFDALDGESEEPMDVVAEYDPLESIPEAQDPGAPNPKAPTPEEAAAYSMLMQIVMNMSGMGPSGVEAATGGDRKKSTKLEMITKYVNDKYSKECELTRDWLKRAGDEPDVNDILPYWLRECIEAGTQQDPEGEENMTLGTQFLARINEAKEPKKAYAFDRGTESMKKAMRDIGGENNFADKIAEVMNMVGVPGMYLNKPEVRESVVKAATTLRSKPARVRGFSAMHAALSNFHGVVKEAAAPDDEANLEGNSFQKLIEEVLVSLGAPTDLVGSNGKPPVKAGIKRVAAKLRSDDMVRSAIVAYARYSGIKVNDGEVGIKKTPQEKAKAEADKAAALKKGGKAAVGKDGKPLKEATTSGTIGTDADGDSAQTDQALMKDPVAAAKKIMVAMGLDLTDKVFTGDNLGVIERHMKAALRNANVKQAMNAFLRVLR